MKYSICNLCGEKSNLIFNRSILNKYDVSYYKCPKCDLIQTEKPYWLNDAYSEAITALDVGLVARNLILRDRTIKIIRKYFSFHNKKFLDYAGGYGLFTRLMRDVGFSFYNTDPYCQNIFAKHFDLENLKDDERQFELVTAFEVMEHLEKPVEEIEKMRKFSKSILFSTELQPRDPARLNTWWYIVPEVGQHVSFYSEKTLKYIAAKFGCNVYSDGKSLHLLTDKTFGSDPLRDGTVVIFFKKGWRFLQRIYGRIQRKIFNVRPITSLVSSDFYLLKKKLNGGQENK